MPQVQVLNDVTARYNIDSMVDGGGSGSGGSTGGIMVIHENNSQLDKTWQEIFDAMKSEMLVILNVTVEDTLNTSSMNKMIAFASGSFGTYKVGYFEGNTRYEYTTSSPDGYPETEGDIG